MNYNKLTKEEKKDIREKYAKTKKGNYLLPILNRLFIWGILSFLCAIILVVLTIINNYPWYSWCAAIGLVIAGAVFVVNEHNIRIKEYNKVIQKKIK